MSGNRTRKALPGHLTVEERAFYEELRRLTGLAGLSTRMLEKAGSLGGYGHTQWDRWLNGTARPSATIVTNLAELLVGHRIDAGHLPGLWSRAFAGTPPVWPEEPPARRPHQLPPSVAHFTGRYDELQALDDLAGMTEAGGGAVAITAIGGTAGVGKTALAVHWAHQAAIRFPDGQLYVNLRGYDLSGEPVRPAEAIQWLLEALAVPAAHIPAGLQAQTGLYRSLLAGRKMLIVLDNARDPAQVRPLLPGTPGSMALVTSRSQLTGLAAADGAQMVFLDVLGTAEASALLARRLGGRATAEPAAVRDLARLCAQLPLALNIAAALAVAQPARPLANLADDLRGQQALDALDTGDEASSLRAVLSWSYQRLSPAPARMFRLLGLHPGPDITVAAAASMAGVAAPEARRALGDLTAAHLLAEHAPGRYAFHDLLRAYAADLARTRDSDAGRQAAVGRMIDHYMHTAHAAAALMCPGRDLLILAPPLDAVTPEPLADACAALGWFAAERLVLAAAVTLAAETRHSRQAWQLGWTAGRFLQRGGYQDEWNAVLRTALAAAEAADDTEGQAHIHRDLGAADTKQPAEAEQHLEQAMNLYGQLGNTAGQAYTELYLSSICEVRGVNRQTLDHALQAMRLFRTIQHTAGQANALTNAGAAQLELGEHQKALAYLQKALPLHRESGNLDGECYAWAGLGEAYFHLGRHDQAIGCGKRSAAMSRELGNRNLLAEVLGRLGDHLAAVGQPGPAREAWLEALAILDNLQDPAAAEIRGKLAESTAVLAGS